MICPGKRINILILVLSCGISACSLSDTDDGKRGIGLHVRPSGTIVKDGKPFKGLGLNYYGAFVRSYENGTKDYEEAFKTIASYNIPFIRMPLCGYSATYYEDFDNDSETIISTMEDVLDCAKENKLGVIATFNWNTCAIPMHVGEKRSEIGNVNSQTVEYASNYVSKIVGKFKDHEAIWGWETDNEYNLGADLFDSEYKEYLDSLIDKDNVTAEDYFTSKEARTFRSVISETIRKHDTYRMISNGNGDMRDCSYSLHEASEKINPEHEWIMNWKVDSYTNFQKMNDYYAPYSIDTMSFHLQHGTLNSTNPSYIFEYSRHNKKLTTLEYFKEYVETAKKYKKGLYLGEFGDLVDMENAGNALEVFEQIGKDIIDSGIQIASSWQFQDFTLDGSNRGKLEILQKLNGVL